MKSIKHLISFSLFFTLGLFGLLIQGQALAADDDSNVSDLAGFSMDLDLPDNQTDPSLGYFSLKVTPGQQQTVAIELSNPTKEATTVEVEVNQAFTNSNGVIEYSKTSKDLDPSQLFNYKDVVTAPETVELAAGETKKLDIQIKVPETQFSGVLAGGIRLAAKDKEEDTKASSSGSTVKNKYAYVIGLVLRESDTDPEPDLTYNKTYADQSNGRNTIYVDYSNIQPTFLNNMTTEVQISKEGSNEVLYETKKTGMRMAPNSNITFPVSMNGESMVAGKYTSHTLVTSNTGRWEWTENFTITKEDADKFNERDVGLVQDKGMNWILVASIVAGIVLLAILIFFIISRLSNNKKKKQKSRKKNGKKNSKKKK